VEDEDGELLVVIDPVVDTEDVLITVVEPVEDEDGELLVVIDPVVDTEDVLITVVEPVEDEVAEGEGLRVGMLRNVCETSSEVNVRAYTRTSSI
jgi:ACT domain-containing protein